MNDIEKRARELLAGCLDEWGHPCEAENVREGVDLESYESELRVVSQLLRFGMNTADGKERAALMPPDGFVLVPVEPTEAMCEAGNEAESECRFAEEIYADMLAARPDVQE